MIIRINIKVSALFAVLFASMIAAPSEAGTLCEKGKIRSISSDYGSSQFVVSTGTTTAGLSRAGILKLYGTVIWQESSYARWDEKYTLIKAAYATDSYVFVWSSDNNCAGPQDEFRIVVCQTQDDCDE